MNETQKTGIFAAIAAVAVLLAYVTSPATITKEEEKGTLKAGDVLFKDEAADVTKAASLKITKFDENKLSMESFEIVRDKGNGLWKIPSEYNYPADADEQLKNVTSPLAGLKILSINEDATQGDHALFGVIEPTDKLEAGVTGVGMLVRVADTAGKTMAGLIIGKKVEKTQDSLHYVRIPNEDPVYTVELDTAAFDTNFKKWIKPDLLNVKSFDITSIGIRDYQTQQQPGPQGIRVALARTMEADASYDMGTSKWNLDRLVEFEGATAKPVALAESEEVKADKLNALRTAAQSLQIVGVRPKPKGLAADLKADKALLDDQESMLSLLDQGFVPFANGDTTEILANAGETLLTTKDGVRYTLRFGEERITSASAEPNAADKPDAPAATESKRERYLLVTASLDDTKFPPPDLQPVPETIEDLKKMDADKAAAEAARKAAAEKAAAPAAPVEINVPGTPEAPKADEAPPAEPKPAEPKADDAKPAADKPEAPAEPKPEEPKPEATKPEEPKPEEPKAPEPKPEQESTCGLVEEVEEQEAATQEPAKVDQPKADDKPAADKPAEDKPAEVKPAEASQAEAKPVDAAKPADAKAPPTDEELKDRLSVVQSEITKSNQRLLDQRNERLNAARKKVQELNARFADWYYLIDDASFKQLMIKRDLLVGPKSAPAPAGAPGAPGFPGAQGLQGLPPNLNFGNQ